MRHALVVFESMFGNTEEVAKAVAEGLAAHMTVDSVEVGHAKKEVEVDIDLLVVGGPTHAFGMSRPSTREDAAKQAGGTVVSSGIGIREWLDGITKPKGEVQAATFDTRVRKPRVPGSAAHAAEKRLRRIGFPIARRSENFWVMGSPGPLFQGEVERAREWGEKLGAAMATKGTQRAS